jgi:putative ABC transport system permease protein
MMFVLRMAAREVRAAWRRLFFFFLCIAIGVGAIVALRSVIQNVRAELSGQARALIAADILVTTDRPWTDGVRRTIEEWLRRTGSFATDAVEMATMVRAAREGSTPRMAELRAVNREFPFYGRVEIADGRYSHDLLKGQGALVRPELLAQLGVRVGDPIFIGRETFTVRGVLTKEPGRRPGAFSFGPRVLIDAADLPRTGLFGFGSRARRQILIKTADDEVQRLARELTDEFREEFVRVRSYRSTEDDVGEDLQRTEDYLSLIGFVVLLLGGIGVWSVTRVFVDQKVRTVAVLKCLGASAGVVLAVYLLQALLLGAAGSAVGVLLARLAIAGVETRLVAALPDVTFGVTGSAAVQGMAIGLLVSLLFSLVPLLEMRRVKPLLLLRHELGQPSAPVKAERRIAALATALRDVDRARAAAVIALAGALVAVAIWQAGSLRAGLLVSLGFLGTAVTLQGAAWLLIRAVRPLTATRWFPLRHAVLGLTRPGNQTRVILLAVGLGSFFILGVRAIQSNLLRELAVELRADSPDMFLLDVQQDQLDDVRRYLATTIGAEAGRLVPVLRARVTAVRGREVNLESFEDVRGRGSLAREYVVTYRDRLDANERLLAGELWPTGAAGESQVSIEQSIRERFDIQVGDLMRFDVLGRVFEARVTSVREVDWADARRGGFMFVFRPGTFDGAPHGYVGFVKAPETAAVRARIQRELVGRYPNISVIDAREVIEMLRVIVENVALAISIVGGIALLSGVLILVGSIAMTKFHRLYEAAILKTLGATSRQVGLLLLLEYGALGALAGTIGAAAAIVLSWAAARHLFDIRWEPAPLVAAAGVVATTVLVAAVGVLSSLDVLRRRPLAVLRAE